MLSSVNDIQQSHPHPVPSRYRRIVVKAGTGVLTGGSDHLDPEVMRGLVVQIAKLHEEGAEVVLVSSGAVAAGRYILGLEKERRDIPFRQVLAAVGQSRLMRTYEELFAEHDVMTAQALLTWNDLSHRQSYLNVRNALAALLELRVVPVLNENDVVAVDEIGEVFGDNDRLSALVSNLVDADLVVLLTQVDGLYTADPREHPDAEKLERVEKVDSAIEALASRNMDPRARGGMGTKLQAARTVTSAGASMIICNGYEEDVILRAAKGQEVGTLFPPTASKMESRKRWMLSAPAGKGSVVVDQGAVAALGEENRSLLPAGVKSVTGDFQRGDIVGIVGPQGNKFGCGIANYSSADTERVKGARSDRIQGILGYNYGQEIIHRNNLVLL